VLFAAAAGAQDLPVRTATPPDRGGRTERAFRITEPLTLDGRLDEEVYSTIPPITGFVQQEPRLGAPATEQTEAWILFDDKNLYVSARLWDSQPGRIKGTETRRDNGAVTTQDDSFSVSFDTFHDHTSGMLFITNPIGALMDGSFMNEKEYNTNFDPVWVPHTARFEGGWSVEIEIPFKSLRYPSSGPQTWGFHMRRVIRSKNEVVHLVPIEPSFGLFGVVRMAGEVTLLGVETPAASKNIELKPYALSSAVTDRLAAPPVSGKLDGSLGFDTKYGITRGLVADFTYNTDFAQVESDQQQVNLTRFSLLYPEKRDFFLEGQGVFNFGSGADTTELPVLFFSRRIGLEGSAAVPILAGGRVTGKVDRFSIGVLDIQTKASALAQTPATTFRALRVKRDLLKRSSIGFIATQRTASGAPQNIAWGVDTNMSFGVTTANAYYARTRTNGQSGRTSSYYGQLDYNADKYGVTMEHLTVEPQFDPEVGFLRRPDFRKEYGYFRYSPRPKHLHGVRKLYYEGSLKYITDNFNRLQSRAAVVDVRSDLENGDGLALTYERDYEFLPSLFPIASGVNIPVGAYPFSSETASYTLGPAHPVHGTIAATVGSFYGGTKRSLNLTGGRFEPVRHVQVEPTVSENWIDLPFGRFRTDLISTRAAYLFSSWADVGALIQYNSMTNSLSTNVRFHWQYTPGSDFYVVYNDARTTLVPDHLTELQSRTILIKVTKLLRY
jgi:hypothetical protein